MTDAKRARALPAVLAVCLPPALLAARCIDSYIEARVKEAEGAADAAQPDPRLVAVVERLFERCYTVRYMQLFQSRLWGAWPAVAGVGRCYLACASLLARLCGDCCRHP